MTMPRNVVFILFCMAAVSLPASAAPAGLTPEQSLDEDLSGPGVAWLGEIIDVFPVGDDTCFMLNRVGEIDEGYAPTPIRFMACNSGGFDGEDFTPGKLLKVEGNLGRAMPRLVGGQSLTTHLVAAAKLTPQPDVPASRPGYYYGYGYPYDDPFYDPWYPRGGFGFGFHYRRR